MLTDKFQNDINDLVEEFNFKGEKRFKLIVLKEFIPDNIKSILIQPPKPMSIPLETFRLLWI